MARIFVTGSSDGLGRMAAERLVAAGHRVVLHARSEARAGQAMAQVPGAEQALVGDLSRLDETRALAEQANRLGRFDAVIHNAGVGYRSQQRVETADGLPLVFAVNTLSPYVLTALMERPDRLVYIGSGMHRGAEPSLDDLEWRTRRWSGATAYAESKLHDVLLAFAIARRWPAVGSNAVEPGWVPTKMGGPAAPDDLAQAPTTQAWLAAGDDAEARVSGRYFFHMKERAADAAASKVETQERLLAACARISGVPFPD